MEQSDGDVRLVARLIDGDALALDRLYDRYASVVFSLLLRVVSDRLVAEELVQEVFLRAWQRASTYQETRGRVMPWLLGIAHNLAVDELRRRRRRPQVVDGRDDADEVIAALPDPGPDVAEEAWIRLRRVQIDDALARLPAAQRHAIELAYFGGYSQTEIATRLGEPLGTVKTRVRLGLRKLREIVQDEGLAAEVG